MLHGTISGLQEGSSHEDVWRFGTSLFCQEPAGFSLAGSRQTTPKQTGWIPLTVPVPSDMVNRLPVLFMDETGFNPFPPPPPPPHKLGMLEGHA